MGIVKINDDENFFDPTPKLKSSPIPIKFISFSEEDFKCIYCSEEYIYTLFARQKYCKKCLSRYLTDIADNNIYLDVSYIMNLKCIKHEIRTKEPQFQSSCRNCLEIFYFKQILVYNISNNSLYEKYCRLCNKSLYQGTNIIGTRQLNLCSNCYLISFGCIGSTSIKKSIPVIYLPWWHNISYCDACSEFLTFTSDCQKHCKNCLIFYIGCRYCLTTNIIFGFTNQSQCKKCKRVSFDTNIFSGNRELDELLLNLVFPDVYNISKTDEFVDKKIDNNKYFLPSETISTIRSMCQNHKNTQSEILMDQSERSIEWIPYSQFTNVVEIAKEEFGIIYYHATWAQKSVILKKFMSSPETGKHFLNELKSNCYEIKRHIVRIHGVTKDLKLGNYILVTQYASGGVLHNWFMSNVKNYKYVEFSDCLQHDEMDLTKLMIFDPTTPKPKSSPIPIKFISFNEYDYKCIYCEEEYIVTFSDRKKYCKKCLSSYLTNLTGINTYLDIYIFTRKLESSKYEISKTEEPQNIQECCRNCLGILFFKQMPVDVFYWSNYTIIEHSLYNNYMVENEKFCKLCGNSLYQERMMVSSGYIKSTLAKNSIPIIHLPWWHNVSRCDACNKSLIFTSDYQKYCENCLVFYNGCRYCLTTNIIFGLTTQSQCIKCERISSVIVNILSGNNDLDDFIFNLRPYKNLRIDEFSDKIKNNDKYILSSEINSTIHSICQNYKDTQSKDQSEKLMEWIPYSRFTNVVVITEGGFDIIYRATLDQENVILKKFKNSQDTSKYFLNELKSNRACYEIKYHISKICGITKDLKSGDYMLVMQYASAEDLHNWFICEKYYKYVEFSNCLRHSNLLDSTKPVNFDSTPKLKPSPIQINFISFNENDNKCIYCEEEYIYTLFFTGQKYCKNCLSRYLNSIEDNNMYLDIYYTMNLECIEHEIGTKASQVKEFCRNCLKVLFFKQILFEHNTDRSLIKSENYCKLCENSICQKTDLLKTVQFKLLSNCYLISTGYLESISSKEEHISVIHLPWWHNIYSCVTCSKSLIFTSDCQKYCDNCLIFYIGCRYCLTTNIIFGLTTQSQCIKCERTSSVIVNILSGNNDLDDFIINLRPGIYNNLRIDEFSDKIKNNDKYFLSSEINSTIHSICQRYKDSQSKDQSKKLMEWIPYSRFTNVVEIAKGGFGIIYRATLVQENVILKKFKNSQDTINKYFLNELESNQACYEIKHHIISRICGITKDLKSGDYMLVMQYASIGDLQNWLMLYEKNYKYVEFSNYLQHNEVDLIKPTNFSQFPELKSSPISIKFISFNANDNKCIYCEEEYTQTPFWQKYCNNCLSCYLNSIENNNMYLDIYYTMSLECIEHEIRTKASQVIKECCRNCLKVLFFKQIFEHNADRSLIKSENYCKLCENSICQETDMLKMVQFKLPSDCYLISTGYLESILTKELISVIYIPWWHNIYSCVACSNSLIFTSDCQKYCDNCLIFYIGCRYCLTTNIIFGLITQSQCKKCERISSVTVAILSNNDDLDNFIIDLKPGFYNNLRIEEFADKIKNNDKYFLPLEINSTIQSICQSYKDTQSMDQSEKLMEWIPYYQFTNVVEIAKGGFGIIYRATLVQENVILKKFQNSQDTSKYFLNELKSNQNCYEIKHHIIRTHGITKDPKSGDYMLVMQYASGGDLHNWLQNKFAEIKWNKDKLIILWQISEGLETIHNILDGERPEITEDTPECYADLMKSCWDPDPKKRPSAKMIRNTLGSWSFRNKNNYIFDNAELKRNELLKSEKLGPEFAKKPHPKAIYTSRSLSPFISKCSSINSYSNISFDNKQGCGYVSLEQGFDIYNGYDSIEQDLDIDNDYYDSIEQDFDIDINSALHSNAITSKKRNSEESNVEIHDNGGKHVKTNSSNPKTT
ncbi:kinase-like domain-containing protein [Rhizophagus clarus]|uniref:Kinase-like domain-containing protein n=1 Tax=Rhizophagus clarus TaxID=94130 RepID=A0A8H3L9P7_9GLOM|nr:kinase-like domain-containing protein [Rhizophagus clarus]